MPQGHYDHYQLDVLNPDGGQSVFSVTQAGREIRVVGNGATHVVHDLAGSVDDEIETVFNVEVIGRHLKAVGR